MKRFAWGITLAVFGALAVLGGLMQGNNPQGVVGGVLMVGGGGLMAYYGQRYLAAKKAATEIALQMLRQNDKIDAAELARRVGGSEVDVRGYLAESQRKGLIPFKAEIG